MTTLLTHPAQRLTLALLLAAIVLLAAPAASPAAAQEPTPEPPPQSVVTATPQQSVNLRTSPFNEGQVFSVAPAGQPLTVVGRSRSGTWLLVDGNGLRGWCAAWYTAIEGDLSTVPVTMEVVPIPVPQPVATSEAFTLALGGQVEGLLDQPGLLRRAGMSWVKHQIVWTDTAPEDVQALVDVAHAQGFKVLLSITGERYPTETIDYDGYIAYLRQVAAYAPDAIEVWNEMNLSTEWPAGQIDPVAYVQLMLAPAYRTIKAVSPNTMVISGALASTGVHNHVTVWSDDYYTYHMEHAGAAQFADCIGFHYNAGATSPSIMSDHPGDDGSGHYSWYFAPTIDVYRGIYGSDQALCLTELGFLSGEGYPPLPEDWGWAAGTSAADQAEWLAESVRYAQALGGIELAIVWNVDFSTSGTDGTDPQAGFAILRPDGSCPACDALSQVVAPAPGS